MPTENGHDVHVEWINDEAHPVGITDFDYDSLDTLEDRARERLATGQPLSPLLEEAAQSILESGPPKLVDRLVTRIYRIAGQEVATRFIAIMLDAPFPRFRLAAIAHEIGASVLGGESVPETAKKFGKSKQALFQEMERVREMMGFSLPRSNQRSEEAREKMRTTNFKHRG
jgi:hypothetical protein